MKPIRLLAILEATTITGPAKNLLQFAALARNPPFDPPVEVSIVTFRRAGDSDLLLKTAEQAHIPIHPIIERGPFDSAVFAALSSVVRQTAPDVIQTHAVKSHFLVRLSGLHQLSPWVAFHHGYTWPSLRARVYNQLDRWSLRAARRVVTVSTPFRNMLVRHGVDPERITVVHNAVDSDWRGSDRSSAESLRNELGIAKGKKVILIVGRLSREKDHLTLVDVVHQIHQAGGFAPHLVIVGEGPERVRIEQRIQALRLAEHVSMTGQTSSVDRYYGIADLAVLSSRTEGSPNALLEAMAARVPVVATAVGGIPEIVTDQDSALLVPPGMRDSMARAVTSLLTDRGLAERLACRARELVETRFFPESRARDLCALYRDLHL